MGTDNDTPFMRLACNPNIRLEVAVTLGNDVQTEQTVTLCNTERRSGLYVLGKPGMGKSSLLVNLILQDIGFNSGVFFLDPHGDAISDIYSRSCTTSIRKGYYLLDPENETHSFGINLLSCPDITSLKQRTDTYTRAYSVFHKLWEDEWGPWLQLIIQNTLYVFIENQEYTLADVPLFFTNTTFRNHLVGNVKYNLDVADFWQHRFGEKQEADQQKQIDAALTRISILLGHPYVKHIVAQQKTTIDFPNIMDTSGILLVKLSANLAPDIKKFIGIILITELLHAVRNRPEGKRNQFCVYVDEFQNFATDQFADLITEGRKFGIATTISHQERFGQFADNKKMLGATAAAANKVFFQLTVRDAQELAPEFADTPQATEKRQEAKLVLCLRPIEHIWERGHPNREFVMEARSRYFWLADLLRTNPQQKYFEFNPARSTYSAQDQAGELHWHELDDWGMYRSSLEMVKQGIDILNGYYSVAMLGRDFENEFPDDTDIQIIHKVLECLGGVLGLRPTMQPYLPPEKQELILHAIRQRDIKLTKDVMQQFRETEGTRKPNWWADQLSEERQREQRQRLFDLEGGRNDPDIAARMPRNIRPQDVSSVKTFALNVGISPHEAENLVEWELRPISSKEKERLEGIIRLTARNLKTNKPTKEELKEEHRRVSVAYGVLLLHDALERRFGKGYNAADPFISEYAKKVEDRLYWQIVAISQFCVYCFNLCGFALGREPIRVQSGSYKETLKVERTQIDLINEKAQELGNLPRFTAYAKILQERDGKQMTVKHKIQTRPLPTKPKFYFLSILDYTSLCVKREAIEQEIQERQRKWRRGTPPNSPERPPPREM